jgi:hypothetical protein
VGEIGKPGGRRAADVVSIWDSMIDQGILYAGRGNPLAVSAQYLARRDLKNWWNATRQPSVRDDTLSNGHFEIFTRANRTGETFPDRLTHNIQSFNMTAWRGAINRPRAERCRTSAHQQTCGESWHLLFRGSERSAGFHSKI